MFYLSLLTEIEGLFKWGKCCFGLNGKWLDPQEFRSRLSEEMWRRVCAGYCIQGATERHAVSDRSCPENTIAHPGRYGVKECQRVSWKSWPKSICWQPKNFICSGALQVVTESQQLISANRFFQTVSFQRTSSRLFKSVRLKSLSPRDIFDIPYVMTCWNDLSKSCCRFFLIVGLLIMRLYCNFMCSRSFFCSHDRLKKQVIDIKEPK